MSAYTLSGYLSPSESPPTFLIPVFTHHGSNELFAQNLETNGRILSFLPIDAKLLYTVQELPIESERDTGDNGLLAYWKEDGGVLIGELNTISGILSSYPASDPFVNLELGAMLQDEERRLCAIDAIVDLLPDRELAARWRGQEVSAVSTGPLNMDGDAARDVGGAANENDAAFESLLTELDPRKWADVWQHLWRAGYNKSRLEEVVFWWADMGPGPGSPAGPVYLTIANHGRDQKVGTYVANWLYANELTAQHWSVIWQAMRGRSSDKSITQRLDSLALEKLHTSVEIDGRPIHNWITTWYHLFRRRTKTSECLLLAESLWVRSRMATRYFADWVLDPALHEVEYPLSLIDAAQSWLINDMRSITLWADLYVRVFAARPSDDMITIGESWLVGHGGNMNSWIDVWRLVRPHIDDGRACEIALGWLARSRWDLTSWPNVFNEVAGMKSARAFVPRIVMVGRNWQAYHSEYPYNAKKVRQSIDYLEAMSKTSSNAD